MGALVGRGAGLAVGVGSGVGLAVDVCVGVTSCPDSETVSSGAVASRDSANAFSGAAGSLETFSRWSLDASMDRGFFARSEPSCISAGCLRAALSSDSASETGLSDGTLGATVHAAITTTTGNTNMIGESRINLSYS